MREAESDLSLLVRAAEAAGAEALGYFRADPKVWEKDGGAGPVTEADLAADALLKDMLLGARPDYGWLSEEGAADPRRYAAARVFVVDPIDGTRAFIAGQTPWAVSVAVVEAGVPIAGVVAMPAKARLYAAARGQGAHRDGTTLRASEAAGLGGATLLAARPTLDPAHWAGAVPPVTRAFRPSLAYRMCLVAEGRFDAMLSFRDTWEWDIAAGALIAAEAGAMVTDARGAALAFNRAPPSSAGVLAAPPALHAALQAARAA